MPQRCTRRRLLRRSLGAAVLLAGCGQKGPLYLPSETQAGDREKSRDESNASRSKRSAGAS